jgi:replicative DNA helicase
MTSGLHPAEMIVIAARPSMGKTAFAMNIAEHVALTAGKAVAIFSLEMSSSQLVQRMLCSIAKINLQKIRNGFLSERDFPALTSAASKLHGCPDSHRRHRRSFDFRAASKGETNEVSARHPIDRH